MHVISKRALAEFWARHPQAEKPLRTWHGIARSSTWTSPQDIRDMFGNSVDFVADNRVIFDIGGNKYRLVCHLSYPYKRVFVRFIGTHKDYDKIDPETV